MTQDALNKSVGTLASGVVSDPRWSREADDLGVSILGMILYGYSLAIGRLVMFLDIEHIDESVRQAITTHVGSAPNWTSGLVAEANRSAFDPNYHPGNFSLVGVGHSYFGNDNQSQIIDNVFANIKSFRTS
jgi:hypothetical protein